MTTFGLRWLSAVGLATGLIVASPVASQPANPPVTGTPVALPQGGHAEAGAVVERLQEGLVGVMKMATGTGFEARVKALDPLIRGAFNLPLMARTSVGPFWDRMSEAQRTQFVNVFSRLSVAHYADRFKGFGGEKFELLGAQDGPRDSVLIETRLLVPDGDNVALNYLARPADAGKWQIVDVFVDGSISELAVRRSEYTSILRGQGVDGLIETLERKINQLARDSAA